MINEIMTSDISNITNLINYIRNISNRNELILSENLEEEFNNIILKNNIENKLIFEKEINKVQLCLFKDCYINSIFKLKRTLFSLIIFDSLIIFL